MSCISFELGQSTNLTPAIISKVKAGCQLLERILQDAEFQRWAIGFQWQTNDGQTFRRFYYSCGRNNEEVYRSLAHGAYWYKTTDSGSEAKEVFNVALCQSVEEYNKNRSIPKTICLDQRYLSKPNYTPIHLAAALCQEYCIHLGYPPKATDHNECWSKFTVPVAMARIVRDVAVIMARDNIQIMEWCMLNDSFQFHYQPCSFTFGLQQVGKDIYDNNNNKHLKTKRDLEDQVTHDKKLGILTSLSN